MYLLQSNLERSRWTRRTCHSEIPRKVHFSFSVFFQAQLKMEPSHVESETNGEMKEIEMQTIPIHDAGTGSFPTQAPTVHMRQSFASPGIGIAELSYDQTSEKPCCQMPIFLPLGRFITYWNFLLLILMVYSVFEIPYSFCFKEYTSPADPVVIIGFVIDVFLLIDVFINFRLAYVHPHDQLRIITDPKLIARRYFKTWFIIDMLASTPFTYFILLARGGDVDVGTIDLLYVFKALRALKLFRIAKILHVSRMFQVLLLGRVYFRLNSTTRRMMKVGKILCVMILTAHYVGMLVFLENVVHVHIFLRLNPFSFCSEYLESEYTACIWHVIGRAEYKRGRRSWLDKVEENGDDIDDQWIMYSYSIYWAIATVKLSINHLCASNVGVHLFFQYTLQEILYDVFTTLTTVIHNGIRRHFSKQCPRTMDEFHHDSDR